MINVEKIETERLVLKKLGVSHFSEKYLSWLRNKDVNAFTFVNPDYSADELKTFLKDVESKSMCFYAIHAKENMDHIGNVKIDQISQEHGFGEYGIMLGDKNYWGKGLGKEASDAIIDFVFNTLDLRKVNLHVSSQNIQGIRLYYKMGFRLEGVLKKHFKYKYGYDDVLVMAKYNPLYD